MTFSYPPAFPIKELLDWATYVTEYEAGAEQTVPNACYPHREWDMTYISKVGSGQVDYLRDFINRHKKENRVFMWKELGRSSREQVKIGHGNGTQRNWLLPLIEVNSLSFYVNSTKIDYTLSTGGTASLGIIVAPLVPAYGDVVTISYMDSYYCPIVTVRDVFQYTHKAYPNYGEMLFTLIEVKRDYPAA